MSSSGIQGRYGAPLDPHAFFAPDSPSRSIPGLAFWEWEVASGRISCSPEWNALLGLDAGHQPGVDMEWWWRLVPEEDKAELREAFLECASGRKPVFEISLRVQRPDTRVAWMLFKGMAVNDDSGRALRIAGCTADITSLRTDPRFLPHMGDNAATYRAMLENSPDLFLRFDRDVLPLYTNSTISRYLHALPETLGAATYDELGITKELRLFFQHNVEAVFKKGSVIKETVHFCSPVIGAVTGECYFWPEFNPDGKVKAVICQVRDRTEQERVEQEVRLNQERLDALYRLTQMQEASEESIINFVVEQIALLTRSKHSYMFFPGAGEGVRGRVYWSRSMRELIGPDDLPLDKMPHDCCDGEHPFDIHGEVITPSIVNMKDEERGHTVFKILCVRRYIILPAIEDGRVVCIASACNKDRDYDESDLRQMQLFINGVWLVLRRNRSMQDLRKTKEAAEEANRVKSEFLANVSHELRTPLNGMLNMLQLLRISALSSEQQEYVRTASLSGKALLRILSDILDYSRMESGKMDLHIGPFDPHATLLSAMTLFASEAQRKGLDIAAHIDDNLPRALLGDDARVRQIVFNLMGNALKFTEKGGIRLECSLLEHSARNKTWVWLVVRDTGIGIPAHAHSAIFDAFTQLDSSSTRKYPGTGLGLGIVKRLVRMMGGTLAVDSEPGEGTAIHCVLPFDRTTEFLPERPESIGKSDARLDILVAEDDPTSRFAIQAFLRNTGHRIVCVENGHQALEALRLHPFDCLLTDIQMPVMDGLEATRRIRREDCASIVPTDKTTAIVAEAISLAVPERPLAVPKNLLIVALTAHAMTGDREHFLNMGMDMYLSKPVNMEELHTVLAKAAERVSRSRTSRE